MKMAYKPRHELPVTSPDGDGPWPNALQLPIQTRKSIDASQNWFDTTQDPTSVAEGIVSLYVSSISNFVDVQRRDYASGIVPVQRRFLNFPGMNLQYENYHGSERLSLTVFPESVIGGEQLYDINLDGYIVWVHDEINFPNPVNNGYVSTNNITGPYNIFLNNYLIYEGYTIGQQSQAFVIMFGKTALRCVSIENQYNPLATPNNGGLVNAVAPGRARIPASTAPDGKGIPSHQDRPGYFIFNWNDIDNLNPQSVILEGFVGLMPTYVRWSEINNGMFPPQVTKGVHFFDPTNSPLNYKGSNSITVMLQPGKPVQEIQLIDDIFCEFYDRKTLSKASQSWNYTSSQTNGASIIVNNKPLYFGCTAYAPGGSGSTSTTFDLTPDAKAGDDDCLLSGLDQYPPAGLGTLAGLSQSEQSANTIYAAECAAIIEAFNAAQAPVLAALLATVVSDTTAYNTANTTMITKEEDTQEAQGVVNAAQAAYDANPSPANLAALISSKESLAAAEVFAFVITIGPPTVWGGTAVVAQQTALMALTQAQAAYIAAAEAAPTLPQAPPDAGMGIDGFKWRTVDVAGSVWSFGPWQGGS
jgi:hypothetical protein